MAVQAVKNVLSVFDGAPIVENVINLGYCDSE